MLEIGTKVDTSIPESEDVVEALEVRLVPIVDVASVEGGKVRLSERVSIPTAVS